MLQLVKKVTKKVGHPSEVNAKGEPKIVVREAKITANFVDPKSEDSYEEQLAICGGDAKLQTQVFNNGYWRTIQQWETNKLGKVDEVSKGLQKAIDGLVQVGLSVEKARATLMANPELVANLGAAKFEQFVEVSIDNFAEYVLSEPDDKGVRVSRYPDVTDIAEVKPEDSEAEPEK